MPVHLQKRSGIELRYGQQASPHQVDRKGQLYYTRSAVTSRVASTKLTLAVWIYRNYYPGICLTNT